MLESSRNRPYRHRPHVGGVFLRGGYFEELLTGDPTSAPGRWDWLFVVGLLTLDVVLPIPATAVLASLGMAYGPLLGGPSARLAHLPPAPLAFSVPRAQRKRRAVFAGEQGMELGTTFFANQGGWVIALSRWTILLPNCSAATPASRRRQYFAALLCGCAPEFYYAWLGSTDKPHQKTNSSPRLGAAMPAILWGAWSWWQKKRAL